MGWKKLLAYITGSVDEELLLRNEYLVTENRILRNQIEGRVRLNNAERESLAEIGKGLGKQALEEVGSIVKPDTILGWHRKKVAQKSDGSQQRKSPGRPRVDQELEDLVVRMARENRSWGYDRIVGALVELGYTISDQTVGNILKRHDILPAPEREKTTTWKEFIRTHMDVLVATDFFTAEVWTCRGLITYYVLFFIHLESRQVHIAGMTPNPNEQWMMQIARNVTMGGFGVFGALILIMVIIKLTGATSWSWWRTLLPIGIFVGFNVVYMVVGFIYLTWAKIPERADGDEAAILEQHEFSIHHVASMLFFILFADNAVRWLEADDDS